MKIHFLIFVSTALQYYTASLHFLSQGIGDSAQGAANAILFVLLTKRVRTTIFSLKYWRSKLSLCQDSKTRLSDESNPLLEEKSTLKQPATVSYPDSEIFTPARASFSDSLPNVFKFPINVN